MATGTLPFKGNTPAVIFEAILDRAPTSLARLNPELPAELERTIHKALEKDHHFRYQSASEMRTGLKRLKRGSDSVRTAVSVVSRPKRRPSGTLPRRAAHQSSGP